MLAGKEKVISDNNFELLDPKPSEGKEAKRIREANNVAYELLLVIMDESTVTGRNACRIVSGCKTQLLEDKDVYLAWKRLSKKY